MPQTGMCDFERKFTYDLTSCCTCKEYQDRYAVLESQTRQLGNGIMVGMASQVAQFITC